MAKYDVKFSCGHTARIQLVGKIKERERKIAYFEESGLCSECYKAELEQKLKEKGIIIKVAVSPNLDNKGNMQFYLLLDGNTKPIKDTLKSMGYHWTADYEWGMFMTSSHYFWCKCQSSKEELQACIEEAIKLGAKPIGEKHIIETITNDINYKKACENKEKYDAMKDAISKIEKPAIPDLVAGKRWNNTIYGKPGEHNIYLDNKRIMISDDDKSILEKYLLLKKEYKGILAKILKGIAIGNRI